MRTKSKRPGIPTKEELRAMGITSCEEHLRVDGFDKKWITSRRAKIEKSVDSVLENLGPYASSIGVDSIGRSASGLARMI